MIGLLNGRGRNGGEDMNKHSIFLGLITLVWAIGSLIMGTYTFISWGQLVGYGYTFSVVLPSGLALLVFVERYDEIRKRLKK